MFNRYRMNGSKRRGSWLLIAGLVLVIGLAGGAWLAHRMYSDNLQPLSSSETSKIITIESGATVQQIAAQLESEQIIKRAWAFQWYVRNHNLFEGLQAGTYALKPSQSVPEIVDIMTKGKVDTSLVTILPGKRIDQVRDGLINDGFDAKAVERALDPSTYDGHPALVDLPSSVTTLEGFIYPETFERTLTTTPDAIIKLSLDQTAKYLTPEVRAGITAQGLSIYDGVKLASIIEREVPATNPVDRPQVAQVFLKRMREGIKLQSDATASYGAILDGATPSLTYASPYNTYQNTGLPPTPISNVTRTSLEAVANPAGTDYLYFVSGDDNVNYFSRTLEEHEKNVQQHCFKKCGR